MGSVLDTGGSSCHWLWDAVIAFSRRVYCRWIYRLVQNGRDTQKLQFQWGEMMCPSSSDKTIWHLQQPGRALSTHSPTSCHQPDAGYNKNEDRRVTWRSLCSKPTLKGMSQNLLGCIGKTSELAMVGFDEQGHPLVTA